MGEGGYIRIQNRSTHKVEMKIQKGRSVDEVGLGSIQGVVEPGTQLPKQGQAKYGGKYEYIEGEVRLRVQKDGYFYLEAHPEDGPPSTLTIKVDRDNWWVEDRTPDKDSKVALCFDVDEIEGTSKIEIRVYDNVDTADWMNVLQDDIQDEPLCQVGLPGTHDSATYAFNKELGASPDSDLTMTIQDKLDKGKLLGKLTDFVLDTVFERMCKCQKMNIQQQLEHGIRYLDLRVAYHAETNAFWTCHGVYCVEVADVLKQVNEFLKKHPKEIVILDFNHFYGTDGRNKELAALIVQSLGGKVADFNKVKPNSRVSEFWEQGYQAVVFFEKRDDVKDEYGGEMWHRGYIRSSWPEANDPKELHGKLKEIVGTQRDENKFFVLQGILTPDGELIKDQIMDSGGLSLKSIADGTNCKVVDWVEDEFQQETNIVIVDFFDNCSILQSIINHNRKS